MQRGGVDGRHFHGVILRQGGQQNTQAARQHALADPGRSYHQQVMSAGGGNDQGPLGGVLTDNVVQIRRSICGGRCRSVCGWCVRRARRRQRMPVRIAQICHQGGEMVRYQEAPGRTVKRVQRIHRGNDQAPAAAGVIVMQRQCCAQTAPGGAQFAIQAELTEIFELVAGPGRQLPGRTQNADGNGQVEAGAFLGQLGGRQIDNDSALGEVESAVLNGGFHPVPGLPDCRFRQPHQGEPR
jgi:hypothetical protein